MDIYHLRITLVQETDALACVEAFLEKNTKYIHKAIFAYECKLYEGVKSNHHIHGHIEYKLDYKNENVRYYLKTKHPSLYYHQITKEPSKNVLYVCKECRIIRTINYTEGELDDIEQKNQLIEEDKKVDPKTKLINRLKVKHKSLLKFTMNGLLEEIKKIYVLEWDMLPPPQCKALCEYITVKELELYKQNPRIKIDPISLSEIILDPPLMKSWADQNE